MTDDPAEEDEPRDPFRDEPGGPWHYTFRQGEMVFLGLTELPNVFDVIKALKDMPESDLKCIVLERLYVWHAATSGSLEPHEWLLPPASG